MITINLYSPVEMKLKTIEALSEASKSLNPTYEISEAKGPKSCPWLWLRFDERVSEEDWNALKELGYGYSKKREAFYHTCETLPSALMASRRSYGGSKKKATPRSSKKEEEKKKTKKPAPFKFKSL